MTRENYKKAMNLVIELEGVPGTASDRLDKVIKDLRIELTYSIKS